MHINEKIKGYNALPVWSSLHEVIIAQPGSEKTAITKKTTKKTNNITAVFERLFKFTISICFFSIGENYIDINSFSLEE